MFLIDSLSYRILILKNTQKFKVSYANLTPYCSNGVRSFAMGGFSASHYALSLTILNKIKLTPQHQKIKGFYQQ